MSSICKIALCFKIQDPLHCKLLSLATMYVKHGIVRSNSRLLRVSRGVYAKRDYCRSLSTTPVSDSSASKSTDENEIYLHETRIPTYHFQDSLPKLPVPKLEDTLKQYIYFSEPMVSPEAWNATKDIVKEFASNDGLSLQQDLVNLDKKVCDLSVSERLMILTNHAIEIHYIL